MKLVATAIGLVIAAAVVVRLHEARTAPPAQSTTQSAPATGDARVAQLTQQVEALQRSLSAVQSQLASQPRANTAEAARPAKDSPSPELDVEAQRALDAERRREYMAGVAANFNNERVDPAWATRVASQVTSAFEGRDGLRDRLRNVECRAQTCRVEMDEDDANEVSQQMPFVSLALVNVLPSMSVEHIDQGNGRRTMILYLSSQQTAVSVAQK
jgi:hypothetical protein